MLWKLNFEKYLQNQKYELYSKYHLIWIKKEIKESLALSFHERMPKGAALRELQDVHLHLSYWESKYYKNALNKFLKDFDNRENMITLDVGCGDGRFVEYLLQNGFTKVIATDIDLRPLISLSKFVKEKNLEDRVMIIRCSANKIPIKKSKIDLILAIGVFYYMNEEFEESISESNRILKNNGILINSEPDLQGAVYKSFIFEGIDDFIENLKDKKFKEEKGETRYKFRLFEKKDIENVFSKSGFSVLGYHGLSLLPSILRIKMVRGELNSDEIKLREKELWKLFDFFDEFGTLYKHIIWKSKKVKFNI